MHVFPMHKASTVLQISRVNPEIPTVALLQMMRTLDVDGDGMVDYMVRTVH